jgi:hypothetical protein
MKKIKDALFEVHRNAQSVEEYFVPLMRLDEHCLESMTGTMKELAKAQAAISMKKENCICALASCETFERFKRLILAHEEAPKKETEEINEDPDNKSGE